jgi:hypothetical protein
MKDPLKDAYRRLADSIPSYGDAQKAVTAARRRRLAVTVAIPAVVAALAVGGLAAAHTITNSEPPPPAGPSPAPTDTTATTDLNANPGIVSDPAAPGGHFGGLIYRTCDGSSCSVFVIQNIGGNFYNNEFELLDLAELRPDLASILAEPGLGGVTLSYDGAWLGIPNGEDFTLYNVYDKDRVVDLPRGPAGSRWEAYYWSPGYDQAVLAQHVGNRVARYAIVHLGYASNPEKRVVVTDNPSDANLLPIGLGYVYYDGYALGQPIDTSLSVSERPLISSYSFRNLFDPSGDLNPPGLQPEELSRDLAPCMHPGETIAGPEGVPMNFSAAPETSPDQSLATVVFTTSGDNLVPTGIIRGGCSSTRFRPPEGAKRYDLPQSSSDTTWTFLGPIDHKRSLMGKAASGGDEMDLVVVSYLGPPQTVGHLPANSEVLMPGMTFGSLN